MSNYTKIRSGYLIQKKHQTTTKGDIYYRDWVTIGGWDRFSPGKTPYYKDGNFVFTTSNIPDYQKKHKYGDWVGEYTYDDVKDATSEANETSVNQTSNDLRDYALYGSCVELVRSTIEKIICEFPAQITVTDTQLRKPEDDSFITVPGYVIKNPFNIDLHHTNVLLGKYSNPLRYMSYSYEDYQLNGVDITSYNIEYVPNYDDIINCPQNHLYETLVTITINNGATIRGLYINSTIIFVTDDQSIVIKPKQEIIDEYFRELRGFERQLLNRSSKPLYKNKFITPIEGTRGVKYVYRDYIWPSDGYQIDIESPSYTSFVNNLVKTATILDEYDCDNIYRSMTHEAIKNYDWTYTREYSDGEEEENIEGGTRMQQFLRVLGRYFDDIKRYIDGIKFTNNITYNKNNNQADALLTDKASLMGWDVTSIIPSFIDTTNITLTEDKIEVFVIGKEKINDDDERPKWYEGYNVHNITPIKMDNEFMRRLILNSKRIFQTKGTFHAIDMVMGMFGLARNEEDPRMNDYEITEEYRTVKAKEATDDLINTYVDINLNKNEIRLYEDEDDFSGVPIKVIEASNGKQIIVPYYDQTKIYDGNFYFQSQGGWGSNNKEDGDEYKYMETFNYLRVVSRIADMISIGQNELNENDICYVVSIDDIMDYDDSITDLSQLSHMFYVSDLDNVSSYAGWENVNNGSTEIQNKATYLESIISNSTGNNPHVGYGKYDNGKEYFEYMKQPFTWAINNNLLPDADIQQAKQNEFDVSDIPLTTDEEHKKIEIIRDGNEIENYYLNSKVLTITNLRKESDYYKRYFKEVILPYLMQVIPSTTILILKDFD